MKPDFSHHIIPFFVDESSKKDALAEAMAAVTSQTEETETPSKESGAEMDGASALAGNTLTLIQILT